MLPDETCGAGHRQQSRLSAQWMFPEAPTGACGKRPSLLRSFEKERLGRPPRLAARHDLGDITCKIASLRRRARQLARRGEWKALGGCHDHSALDASSLM